MKIRSQTAPLVRTLSFSVGLPVCLVLVATAWTAEPNDQATKQPAAASATVDGRELFVREWLPGDSRSHGGDGLGPMFNESSCVACHNQGGVGGGGPGSKRRYASWTRAVG